MNKGELRLYIKEKRNRLSNGFVKETSEQICRILLESEIYKQSSFIAAYMSFKNEVSTDLIIKTAFEDGKRICVPVTENDKIFLSEIYPEDEFICGAFGIREPKIKRKALGADLIAVPGLAFSKDGSRLGWGGGFYDRLLAETDAVSVGMCYDFQLCGGIETETHDKKTDYIVTESGVIACE